MILEYKETEMASHWQSRWTVTNSLLYHKTRCQLVEGPDLFLFSLPSQQEGGFHIQNHALWLQAESLQWNPHKWYCILSQNTTQAHYHVYHHCPACSLEKNKKRTNHITFWIFCKSWHGKRINIFRPFYFPLQKENAVYQKCYQNCPWNFWGIREFYQKSVKMLFINLVNLW